MKQDNTEATLFMIMFMIIMVIVLVIIGGAIWGKYALDKKRCISAFEAYSPEYKMFYGCRVMWEGKITPVEIIREI